MSVERALKRTREETGTLPESVAGAATWLPDADGEDAAIPAGLLDQFATEEPGSREASGAPVPAAVPAPAVAPDPVEAFVAEGPAFTPDASAFASEAPAFTPEASAFASEAPAFAPEAPAFAPEPQAFAPEPPAAVVEPPSGPAAEPRAERRVPTGLFNGFNPHVAGMLVSGSEMDHGTAEQYGRLAAVLHHAQIERKIKTVMVTSAMAGEGKSLTALNLALTLSESYGRRVAFIDADLRCSRIHELLNVVRVTGLSEALQDGGPMQSRLLPISPVMSVLLAGCSNLDPKGALTSPRMGEVLAEAASAFDWVIIDTPPVVLLPDTNLLARMVDASIVVVRAGKTAYDVVERAIHALDRKRVLGIVLNDVHDGEALEYYYSASASA
jgi:protein-tyrosine kinase